MTDVTAGAWTIGSVDPAIVLALCVAVAAYMAGVRRLWARARGRGVRGWQVAAFLGGMGALFAAVASPLEDAAEDLLSAHMVQHLLLILVAAPLLILGRPGLVLLATLPVRGRRRLRSVAGRWRVPRAARVLEHPVLVWFVHVAVVWAWHVPGAYEAALANQAVHGLEHVTFLGTALPFWWLALGGGARRRLPRGADVLYLLTAWLQSGALGALFALAASPVYPGYAARAVLVGVDPMRDQQVAGLIMWIPAGAVYLGGAIALFLSWLKAVDAETRRAEASAGVSGILRA